VGDAVTNPNRFLKGTRLLILPPHRLTLARFASGQRLAPLGGIPKGLVNSRSACHCTNPENKYAGLSPLDAQPALNIF